MAGMEISLIFIFSEQPFAYLSAVSLAHSVSPPALNHPDVYHHRVCDYHLLFPIAPSPI